MKEFKCYDCEELFQAESREEVLNQLYAHYMKEHNEIITNVDESGKKQWMAKFEEDWLKAKEV